MGKVLGIGLSVVLAVALLAAPASGALVLNYQGSYKTGVNDYDGDLAYDPSGNGGAGSLIMSGVHGAQKLAQIPASTALVIPSNFNTTGTGNGLGQLGTATTTSATFTSGWGLAYAANGSVNWLNNDGYQGCVIGTINNDGTGSTTLRTLGYKNMSGPSAIVSTSYFAGYDKLVVSGVAGVSGGADLRITAVDTLAWTTQALLQYTTAHNRNNVLAGDICEAAAILPDDAEGTLAIVVKSNATATPAHDNRLLLYHLSDIAGNIAAGHNLYDAQPYQTIDLQPQVFVSAAQPHMVFGMTYDSVHNVLYTAEGNYGETTIISAYTVTPEPATLSLLAVGALTLIRRNRK